MTHPNARSFRMQAVPWLLMALAAGSLGSGLALLVLDKYSCGQFIPHDYPLPRWTYVVALVGFCIGRASVWLPVLACAPLLRLPRRISAQIAVFAALFGGLTLMFTAGDSFVYIGTYGGSWLSKALRDLPGSAHLAFWITVATAALTIGQDKFEKRRS